MTDNFTAGTAGTAVSIKPSFTITEIFASIQGESSYVGYPCTFIRLTGCPLRCRWCDTAYGFDGGTSKSLDQIIGEVTALSPRMVEFTGGEPLAQEGVPGMMQEFISRGYRVLIETSGSISVEGLPKETHIVMDLKCPDSNMDQHNLWENLKYLKPSDDIKFVVASEEDFIWARSVIKKHSLTGRFNVLISPAWGLAKPDVLSRWIIEAGIDVRLNLQIHKYIWSPRKKGV